MSARLPKMAFRTSPWPAIVQARFNLNHKRIVLAQMKKNAKKKKPGPKPTGKGEQVVVRLQPDLLGALDKQVEATGAETRAAAIREVLAGYLKRKGLL
jgi:hypothetical protein